LQRNEDKAITLDMNYLKINRYRLYVCAILTFTVLLRILLISLGWPPTNSDEGTMGIMALHIAYKGELPILYYGQFYMGTIEAYLGAAFFHLFGASLLTLRLGPLLLFALFLVSTYLLLSLLYTQKFALVVLLFFSVGSNTMFVWEIYAKGGSTQTLLFGSLAFLLATWLALSRGRDLSAGKRWLRYACYFGWGVAVGLGLWSDMIVAPFFLISALLLLLFCWPEVRSWAPVCLVLGLVVGLFPLIAYNMHAPPNLDSISVMRDMFRGKQVVHTIHTLVHGIKYTVQIAIPTATGIPFCPVQALRYKDNVNPPNAQCFALYTGWGVGYMLLWALAILLTVKALWMLRSHYRFHRLAQTSEKFEVITVHFARFFLLASAGLAISLYAISSAPLTLPASHARYLIGLLIISPAVLWPLWRAASRIQFLRLRGWRFSAQERISTTSSLWLAWQAWLSAGIILCLGIAFLAGTIGISGELPASQAFDRQQDALVHDLIRIGATHIYTDYWTCNNLAFASNEQIVCGVIDSHLYPTHNRVPHYYNIVHADPHAAYVLPPDYNALPAVEKKVAAAGGDAAYRRLFLDGYVIYVLK